MAVAGKNGIDLANIAKINDQTVSSGGAYDPVAGTGTYIETVPTSGLIKFGGVRFSGGILSSDTAESYPRYSYGGQPVVNFSCDEDGAHLRVAESKSDFVHITYGRYSAFGITSSGQMWEIGSSSTYMAGTDDTGNVFTQVTGVGDSDTGWTDVSSSYDGALAINSGKMYYVGLNGYGQAGTGNTTHSFGSFTQVGSATDWQNVKRSRFYSLATKTTSDVLYSAGRNYLYMTGQGTNSGNTTSWTAIDDTNFTNSGITDFGVNYDGGYLITGGEVYAWGDNDSNERFGTNTSADIQVPTQTGKVSGSFQTDWVTGALTNNSMHLINTSGELYHTGEGNVRRGDGLTTDSKNGDFVQIGTDTDWQEIAADPSGIASSDYGLSALKGSKIYFWGYNQFGGVINGTLGNISTATLIVDQTLAAGNVWIPFPNTGNTTRYAIAAIY
jgi:alpha-tubulin suppressor-like RCC1 family protein